MHNKVVLGPFWSRINSVYCLFRLLWERVFPDFVSMIYDFATPCNYIKVTISAAAGQESMLLHQQLLQASCAVYKQWQQAG